MGKQYRLFASVAYVTTLTHASTNDQWARPACPLVSSSKTEPCKFSSVTSLCTRFKAIVNKRGKISVDVDTGVLKIYNVKYEDSTQLFCSAVLPSEERITFTHNLIGMLIYGQNNV